MRKAARTEQQADRAGDGSRAERPRLDRVVGQFGRLHHGCAAGRECRLDLQLVEPLRKGRLLGDERRSLIHVGCVDL